MKIIGITGGVGNGKSALLAAIQEEFRCRVLLADEIAHFLKEPGQSCYEPIIKLLGEQILDEQGFIDKKKMADVIFGDSRFLEEVNKLVHPTVYRGGKTVGAFGLCIRRGCSFCRSRI